jgi:membrane protein DedA with SNARE-associated domain
MSTFVQFLIDHGYYLLFFWVLVEQLGLPLPAAPLFLAAGALARGGQLNVALVFGAAVTAALMSDLCWYHVGRLRGKKALSFMCRISLDRDSCIKHTGELLSRHGGRLLLVAKFLPGLNALATPSAGVARMTLPKFILLDALGSSLWAGAFTAIGYLFSADIGYIAGGLERLGAWAGLIVSGSLAAYVAWKYFRRQSFLRQLSVLRITPEEVKQRLDAGDRLMILDVRSRDEIGEESITLPGAFTLPLAELESHHQQIPRDQDIVLYCG